uniref:Putative viral replication protein n=1 Tax=Siphoviridae sp. ctQtc11 TaxID=2825497 RepID=A0A8S5P4V7_9CAUD|nr:MAG TPA: putative viral replication protein [Siphoviridae sp. ctQtc11]
MHYVYSLEYHGRLHIQLHMYIKNKIRRKLWIQFLQN